MMSYFRKLVLLAAVVLIAAPITQAQGLAERRAIKEYQDKVYTDLKKQIDAAAGYELKTTVNWDKLAVVDKAEHYQDKSFFTNIYFVPLIRALQGITKDEMGKASLKEKMKEVVITFDADKLGDGYVKFDGGVLTINAEPWVNGTDDETPDNFKDRVKDITKTVEAKL